MKVVENYDGYFYKYIFDDSLDKIYPNSQIKYTICFHVVCNQYKYCKESWCDEHRWFSYAEKEGNKYIATIIPAHPNDWAEFEMYYSTMKNYINIYKNLRRNKNERNSTYHRHFSSLKIRAETGKRRKEGVL